MSADIDTLLLQYSAGTLDTPMSILVASYLTLEPEARKKLYFADDLNASIIDSAEPVGMSEDSVQSLMDALDDEPVELIAEEPAPVDNLMSCSDVDLPLPLRRALSTDIDGLKWSFSYPGVKSSKIKADDATSDIRLLKIQPGKSAPRHAHEGIEATLVLRGAFIDGGEVYSRGDLAIADGKVEHRPKAVGDEVCLCLAVTTGSLKFKDRFGRVLKDFIS
ncbi:hypothetical protein IMCC14465_01690 [alpha proteobacterium IMCC14465]|uniref:ChrR-like cupin domain-containing protein n=1 Tax=alpha proteobacterium IMCC14465 TaxID=1220535 RepID=J9A5W1_9PROT|nr:hypothetical protein IMCC14465_01690 [alpha proteobacterium IMCC14465]